MHMWIYKYFQNNSRPGVIGKTRKNKQVSNLYFKVTISNVEGSIVLPIENMGEMLDCV